MKRANKAASPVLVQGESRAAALPKVMRGGHLEPITYSSRPDFDPPRAKCGRFIWIQCPGCLLWFGGSTQRRYCSIRCREIIGEPLYDKRDWKKRKLIPVAKRRDEWLRRRYGITTAEFEAMLVKQKNRCPICKETLLEGKNRGVDHDHDTGKVRAILCNSCNRGIGFFRENIRVMQRAIRYIRTHKGTRGNTSRPRTPFAQLPLLGRAELDKPSEGES